MIEHCDANNELIMVAKWPNSPDGRQAPWGVTLFGFVSRTLYGVYGEDITAAFRG